MKKLQIVLTYLVFLVLLGSKISDVYATEVPAPYWDGKLLKSLKITKWNRTDKAIFTYDEKKRLKTLICEEHDGDVDTYNFTYTDNQMRMEGDGYDYIMNIENGRVVSGTMSSLDYSGATVTFDYDNNDHLVSYTFRLYNMQEVTKFHWEGNDVVSVTNADDESVFYTYTDKTAPPMLQKLIFGDMSGAVITNNLPINLCLMLYMDHGMCDKLISTMKVVDLEDNENKTFNYTYNYNSEGEISSFDVNNAHYELEWETYTETPTPVEKPKFSSNSTIEDLNTAHLYWEPIAGASGYEIKAAYQSEVYSGKEAWETANIQYQTTVGADVNDLKIEHLNYGTNYRFAIRALSPDGEEYNSEWFGYGAPLEFGEFFGLSTSSRYHVPEVVTRGTFTSSTISIQVNRDISGYSEEDKATFREHFNFLDDAKNLLKIDYLTVTPSVANPNATVGSAYTKYQIPESAWDSNGTVQITVDGLTPNAVYNITAWDESIPWEQEACYNTLMVRTKQSDPVTLTAKSYSREYGEANPALEYDVTEGTITDGAPELATEAIATSPVGTYDIVISKGSVSNNEVSLVNGTLTIVKAPLTISCGDYTITQGEALPEFALEYSGWKNNETVDVLTTKPTVTCEATSNSEPGTYDIIVSSAEAENYEISYVAGTLTIEAKPIVIEPVEVETEMKTEELSGQDLSNNVVNDVYYNTGKNSYDSSDGSIVISQTTNFAQIADKEPGSADVKENFNGMILKVAKGKGLITVNVKTSGNAQLVVQVGNGTPMLASKTERGDVVFSYDVEEDTYVYIYAIIGSSAAKGYGLNAADTESSVRIYNITVSPGATGIKSIGASEKNDGNIYDLQGHRVETPAKGIYIIGGRKVSVK
ncbi:MAG: DUF4595 domain-containing protein [Prevotella sp.]|nr:DUF4595 domain-containing protein [Prevotella sp.]